MLLHLRIFAILSKSKIALQMYVHLWCARVSSFNFNSIADGNKFGRTFHLILNDKNMLIISSKHFAEMRMQKKKKKCSK